MSSDVVVVVLSLLASLVFYLRQRNGSPHPLPPGPRPLPILGNLLDIPQTREHETYTQWGKQYGDVVHIHAFGQRLVILNSLKAVNELLDKRSAIYSDRPHIPMLHEHDLMDAGWTFASKHYTDDWRRHRRLFGLHLGPIPARALFQTLTTSAHTLLRSILRDPEDFASSARHAAAETVMHIAYGYQVQATDDPWVDLAERYGKALGPGFQPATYLVNIFPWLMHVPAWFPGTKFKADAAKTRQLGYDMRELPFEDAKKRIDAGTASPSFVTNALTDPDPSFEYNMSDIKEVASTIYGAGQGTVASSFLASVLAFVMNPRVQERAQAELDAVLGSVSSPSFRLPTMKDRSQLPYIDAILLEVQRWFVASPLGVPHAVTEDDVYRDWRIPKGTLVIANAWVILRDEKLYKDPLLFRPERFLGDHPEPDPGTMGVFGFGRRRCPGRHLAESSLWIMLASLLSVFTFSPAKDADGCDIDVNYACAGVGAALLEPLPFPCTITPRSKEAEMRIQETNTDA